MFHIAFAADEKFSYPLQIAIYSLIKNLKCAATIHVISSFLSDDSKEKLQRIVSKHKHQHFLIEFHNIDPNIVKNFPLLNPHLSHVTYYRLFLSSILTCDKVLYLDCDILINQDISEIQDIDITNYYAAGVIDGPNIELNYIQNQQWSDILDTYFNAGVLLFNLYLIRQHSIQRCYIQNLLKYQNTIKFEDQDIINLTLNKILSIPKEYNWLPAYGHGKPFKLFPLNKAFKSLSNSLNKEYKNAKIFHFAGIRKPWLHKTPISVIEKLYKQIRTEYQNFLLE